MKIKYSENFKSRIVENYAALCYYKKQYFKEKHRLRALLRADSEEKNEGNHPCGGLGDEALPADKGNIKAAFAHLRQAHDILSAVGSHECGHKGHTYHIHTYGHS